MIRFAISKKIETNVLTVEMRLKIEKSFNDDRKLDNRGTDANEKTVDISGSGVGFHTRSQFSNDSAVGSINFDYGGVINFHIHHHHRSYCLIFDIK